MSINRLRLYKKISWRLAEYWVEYMRHSGEITEKQASSIMKSVYATDMKISNIIEKKQSDDIRSYFAELEEQSVVKEEMASALRLLISEYTETEGVI